MIIKRNNSNDLSSLYFKDLGTEIVTGGREVLAPELSETDIVTACSPGGRRKREEDLGPLYTITGNCVVA